MIDTHAHLNLEPLFEKSGDYIQNAFTVGVTRIMVVGVTLETSERAIELAKIHPQLWVSVGIHPEESRSRAVSLQQTAALEVLVKTGRVQAIGECGLDYSGDVDRDAQRELFLMQASLAARYRLPLVIHCRNTRRPNEIVPYDAYDDLLSLLHSLETLPRIVLHCVSGPVHYVETALKLGASLSFAGNVTYPNAGSLRELLRITPLDRLLLETDSPFLAPQGKRGTQNEPANVVDTGKYVADFLGKSYEEIDKVTTENALNLFSR